ncbi:hypothetical protein AB0M12_14290 [Nocardia vinacea]|uniref:hypothetical protein n=1 Tax=Nocardia vinacea TaxID=96468 RepID=UPI00342086D9
MDSSRSTRQKLNRPGFGVDTACRDAEPDTLEHLGDYDAARSWHSQEAHVIDTTGLQPGEVATRIAATVVPVEP